MIARDKLSKGIITLRRDPDTRFLSGIASYFVFIEDPTIPTATINDFGEFFYNPTFIDGLSDNEIAFIIAHEANHIVRRDTKEPIRNKGLEHQAHNIAADIKSNDDLKRIIPVGTNYLQSNNNGDFEYQNETINDTANRTTMDIYSEVISKKLTPPQDSTQITAPKNSTNSNQNTGMPKNQGSRDRQWGSRFKRAMDDGGGGKGYGVGSAKRFLKELLPPSISFEDYLADVFEKEIVTDLSLAKPAKKSYARGYVVPSNVYISIAGISALDSSGSVSMEDFTKYMSEIAGIMDMYTQAIMHLWIGDTDLSSEHILTDIDDIASVPLTGGGGTSHEWVFKKIDDEYPDCKILFLFTDGYSDIEICMQRYTPTYKVIAINSEVDLTKYGIEHVYTDTYKGDKHG